ncbi:piggyBac transposable element-derived protein 4-like [Penaeus monodon]|uniref:piggyBac transposable element-derived protein 4-like n=1 Tax=Penaeus monodon TaxID=6687 RepID=UPI0018A773C7|nr:piggyBac transposable element-derived protein 4-like [Penaeus monodon]
MSPAVWDLSFSDVDDPQPSTSGLERLRNAPDPLLYLYSTDEEDYTPLKLARTSDLSEIEISARFDGDDSDWEGSEFDTDESGVDDDLEEDFDYVPLVDTSLDSDEPLAEYVRRHWECNAPGTPSFCWSKRENFVRRHCFERTPGVKAPLEDPARSVHQCFPRGVVPDHCGRDESGWEDTTVREVRSYVGLRFLMGLQSKRDQREWWSMDPLMSSSLFAKTMTRDCYNALTSMHHFADNEGEHPAEDMLWKLRPVLDVLESTYRSVFVPNKNVTVDESLWAIKGRHHTLQYNPSKRARRGLKVYKLCSSDGPEAGHTAAFKIYMGQDCGVFPSSMKAVTDLLEKADLLDKGYQLHTNNWYTSPTLFHYLQTRKTSAVASQPAWHALGPAGESGTNRFPVRQDRNDLPSVGG